MERTAVLFLLIVQRVSLAAASTDWSMEFEPSDPMQTAIITVSCILIFIGIIFLIYVIFRLCTPARRRHRHHRKHCLHHCKRSKAETATAAAGSKDGTPAHHPNDPRSPSPGLNRSDFHTHVANGSSAPVQRDEWPDDSPSYTSSASSPEEVPVVLVGSDVSGVSDKDVIAPNNYAAKYDMKPKIKPQFSREEMVTAAMDDGSSAQSGSAEVATVNSSDGSSSASSHPVPIAHPLLPPDLFFPPGSHVRSISEYGREPDSRQRFSDMSSVATNKTQILIRDPESQSQDSQTPSHNSSSRTPSHS